MALSVYVCVCVCVCVDTKECKFYRDGVVIDTWNQKFFTIDHNS